MALRDIMGWNKYTTTLYMHVFVQSLGSVPKPRQETCLWLNEVSRNRDQHNV
jgi:hypothetical protein